MKRLTTLFILSILPFSIFNQGISRLDSLKLRLDKEKSDTARIKLYYRIAYELQFSDIGSSEEYARKALEESERLRYPEGKGNSLIQMANIEQIKGNLKLSEDYNLQALEILEKVNDQAGIAICLNNLGIISHDRNDYTAALEYYKKSLAINNRIKRQSGSATSLFCIGTVFENLGKYDSALVYYLNGREISERIGSDRLIAYSCTSLANVYFSMGNYLKSLEYNEKAIELYDKMSNYLGLLKTYVSLGQTSELLDSTRQALWFYGQALKTARTLESTNDIATNLFSIGHIHENQGNLDSAYSNYNRALDLFVISENRENEAMTLIAMARLNNLEGKHKLAEGYLESALKIARETGSPSASAEAYRELAITSSALNNFKKAFEFMNRYSDVKDSVMNIEKQKQILELQTRFETEKKEKENLLLQKDSQILKSTRNFLIIFALLIFTVAVVIYRSLAIKRRDNLILKEQKEEIARQKEIVESQNTSITDSIRYAKRIQSALLPPDEMVKGIIPESFILYLPRDIVSGDFYWANKISESKTLVCAADCTGHGVPGAFMSMLGMSLLSDIINRNNDQINEGLFTTADILNKLRIRIKESLRQSGKEGESRDGMDISLCIIDFKTGKLQYSGANNPVYIVDNGILTELKATRNPIGIYLNEMDFSFQTADINSGSVVYMFSDGYSDQIGSDGSKFLSKNFKKLLAQISNLPPFEIRQKLLDVHLDWRKDEEQVDDILVLGVFIS
jgi:serine phosphatase RsbU (regulator of sigma subunit)